MGEERGGCPPPADYGVWESVVSSPNGVWCRATTGNDFGAFYVQLYAISRIF